jgi:hypothetical protein
MEGRMVANDEVRTGVSSHLSAEHIHGRGVGNIEIRWK